MRWLSGIGGMLWIVDFIGGVVSTGPDDGSRAQKITGT
jgi:hypothetical protein